MQQWYNTTMLRESFCQAGENLWQVHGQSYTFSRDAREMMDVHITASVFSIVDTHEKNLSGSGRLPIGPLQRFLSILITAALSIPGTVFGVLILLPAIVL